jgi:phosphomannomutase
VQYLKQTNTRQEYAFFQDLTGFKYLANKAHALEQEGYCIVLAYEEALGYMLGTRVLDKDGLSALGVMAELIYSLPPEHSLASYLLALYEQ